MKKAYNKTVYACYLGYVTQAIVNNLAPLLFIIFQKDFQISLVQVTLITTLNFLVQLFVDFISAYFVDGIGYRTCLVAAHVFSAAGLVGLSVFPGLFAAPYVGILLAVVLYAIGGGLIEVLVSPVVECCPSENKEAAMSLLHSFYCFGTVAVVFLSTAFLFVFGKESWIYLPLLWALLPIANGIFFLKVPILSPEGEGGFSGMVSLFNERLFWILFFLMIAAGASEQGMSQWASAFAESGLQVSKTVGDLMGPCFFSILMGISRAFYGKFGERIPLMPFMRVSALLCIISYSMAALMESPFLSLLGCGLCGLSVGIMWPGTFSLASSHIPSGGTAMFAFLALAGDVGCMSGPTFVGSIAAHFHGSLRMGLLPAVIFPAMMIALSYLLGKYREC